MCKQEFLAQLRQGLSGLPQEDIEERLTFYSEMLDDRIEEGLSEEDAVAQIGTVEKIVSQIMSEIPLTKLVKEKVKPKRALRAWEIVLLILGSPIWLSLLIAAAAVVLSVYAAIWSVMLSMGGGGRNRGVRPWRAGYFCRICMAGECMARSGDARRRSCMRRHIHPALFRM